MKTAFNRVIIAVIIAGLASAELRSQQRSDSLAVYLEIAARNNPGVQKSLLEYQAALQKVPQAGSLPDPELSAGVFLKSMELMSGNQVADFALMQMFPWFGVLRNAKDEMSLMANAQYELFRDAKAQVNYDVQKAWYEIFKIREEIRISGQNKDLLKTIERLSLVKYKSPSAGSVPSQPSGAMSSSGLQAGMPENTSGMGAMTGSQISQSAAPSTGNQSSMSASSMSTSAGGSGLADLYRIQIEIIGLDDRVASMKNRERAVIARFNSLLGRDPMFPVYVDTIPEYNYVKLTETMLLDSIMSNNPMLAMIEYEKQSLETKKKMVTGMGYPMVGLGVSYSLISKSPMSTSSMNGTDMIMPMVSVTIPVYRKKYKAMQNETDLLQAAAEQGYMETANSLRTEFYSALQMYQDASRRTNLYDNQRKLASVSLDLIMKDFSASSSSLTDVLRMQQQVYEYELKFIESNVDMSIATAWITRLMATDTK